LTYHTRYIKLPISLAFERTSIYRIVSYRILRSLHWLRITERIEYKLFLLTYKVLTTTQPSHLHNLISVQRPRNIRSSSVVTLTVLFCHLHHPLFSLCSTLSLKSTHSFHRQPHSGISSSISDSPVPSSITSSSFDSPLCSCITLFLFHSRLKTTCFTHLTSHLVLLLPPGYFHGLLPRPFFSELLGFLFIFFLFFVSVPCARLSWPPRQLLSARKSTASYRIVHSLSLICAPKCRSSLKLLIVTVCFVSLIARPARSHLGNLQ